MMEFRRGNIVHYGIHDAREMRWVIDPYSQYNDVWTRGKAKKHVAQLNRTCKNEDIRYSYTEQCDTCLRPISVREHNAIESIRAAK